MITKLDIIKECDRIKKLMLTHNSFDGLSPDDAYLYWVIREGLEPGWAYNPLLYTLGSLCSRGHEYKNTGKSLRRNAHKLAAVCLECERIGQIKRNIKRSENPDLSKKVKERKQHEPHHYYPDTEERITCPHCKSIYIVVRARSKTPNKKRFYCKDCNTNFTVTLYEVQKRDTQKNIEIDQAIINIYPRPKAKHNNSQPQEQVKIRRNRMQIEQAIIIELQKSELSAKAIAKNIKEPLWIVEGILIDLHEEEDSVVEFDGKNFKIIS